jgi:aminodeoxyfutalosine synthase
MIAKVSEPAALAASHNIITIGMHADDLRREMHGRRTTFVRVADVTVTPGAPIVVPPSAREARIVGLPADRAQAVARVAEVKLAAKGVPLSGFSLADLEQLSTREQITLRALLEDLYAAGLELVAEAPFEQLEDPRRAVEEVNIAGLALARLTIGQTPALDIPSLYGRVAALQRSVAVIRSFAPLPRRFNPAMPSTGYEDIRRVALARLLIENVPSIQVDWSLYGPKLAQVALTVGADDLDGVTAIDDLGEGRRRAPLEEVRRNITAAGLEPVERDGRYDAIGR